MGERLDWGEREDVTWEETGLGAVMRTDGGEHGRHQGSQAMRAQPTAVAGDGENGTGGQVDREEDAWRRATVGQASKEARHPQQEGNAQRECSSAAINDPEA